MSSKVLITYFGPFNHFQENPAELIANKLQLIFQDNQKITFKKLEVSFESIDQFLENTWGEYDTLIELGVATKSNKIRLEVNGTNFVNGIDVKGVQKNGKILEIANQLKNSSFSKIVLNQWSNDFPNEVVISENAGKFLCNYLYYKSLIRYPEKNSLFIHLANFIDIPEALSLEKQLAIISSIIEKTRKL